MHKFKRIVTYTVCSAFIGTPKALLANGSAIYSHSDRTRVFVAREVCYDDDMTPLWSVPSLGDKEYLSVQELKEKHPKLADSPILDFENSLMVWKES